MWLLKVLVLEWWNTLLVKELISTLKIIIRFLNKGAVSIIFVIAVDIKHLSIISLYEMYLGGRFCGSRIGEKGEVGVFRYRALNKVS